jgi:hypothetical protein
MKNIHSKKVLIKLAKQLGVRPDWHEPDEEGVDAKVFGNNFDNAGFWPKGSGAKNFDGKEVVLEKHVVIYKDKKPVAAINLATLLSFACGTYEGWEGNCGE